MRRKIMFMSLLFAGCFFISGNAFAAWTQAKGHSYNQLTLSHYKTVKKYDAIQKDENDNVINPDGKINRNEEEEFTASKLSYYVEYGVKDDLTVIFSGGGEYVTSNDIKAETTDEDSVVGIGDIILGLRQKISNNIGAGVLMSLEGDIKIPEAYEYENPVNYQNLGDGQYDYRAKIKFGRGFSWGYSVLDIGYKYRDYNKQLEDDLYFKPSDEYFISLSGGYNAAKWLSVRGKLEWSDSIGNARVSDDFVTYAAGYGVDKGYEEAVLIVDTLGLEKDSMTAGLALAFTVAKSTQVVLSYDTTISGIGDFKTKNASLGETWSLALAKSF